MTVLGTASLLLMSRMPMHQRRCPNLVQPT
jgi:hypothetical protein